MWATDSVLPCMTPSKRKRVPFHSNCAVRASGSAGHGRGRSADPTRRANADTYLLAAMKDKRCDVSK
jgi:hypothetical protein